MPTGDRDHQEYSGTPEPAGNALPPTPDWQQAWMQVHQAVWQMHTPEDLQQVLGAVRQALLTAGIRFQDCEINVLDLDHVPPRIRSHNLAAPSEWNVEGKQEGLATLLEIWRSGQPAYRPDLAQHDPNREQPLIATLFGHPVRSVLDVPFSRGTLAINSDRPDAFSPSEIRFARDLAGLLSDGFRRLDDLQALEARAREAEALSREHALNLALQRVLNTTLQMQGEEDWPAVVGAFAAELHTLVDFDACSIQRVFLSSGQFRSFSPDRSPIARPLELKAGLRKVVTEQTTLYRRNRAEIDAWGEVIEASIQSVVDVPFDGGTIAMNHPREDAFSEQDLAILERFAPVMSQAYRRLVQLQRQAAVHTVREAIWQLKVYAGLRQILEAIRQQLLRASLPFDEVGLNLVIGGDHPTEVLHHTLRGALGEGVWLTHRDVVGEELPLVVRIWQSGKTAYRPDLQADDPHGEHWDFLPRIRAIVDLPFSHGTLAINSRFPNAFSADDLALLEDLAGVLSEGFQRLEDLRHLEHRTAELQASEERHRNLLADLPVGVVHTTPEGALTYANPYFQRLLGYTGDELLHLPATAFYFDREERQAVLDNLEAEGEADREVRLRRRDGQAIWVRLKIRVRRDGEGTHFASILEDITARKQGAAREQVIGRVRDAIWTMRDSGHIETVMAALYGGLKDLGIPFDDCSVHWMDGTTELPLLRTYRANSGEWHEADIHRPGPTLTTRFWLECLVVYRPDLETSDLFGERERLQQTLPLRSAIDLPFAQGVLALRCVQAHAYGPDTQELLREFAALLEEAFSRLEDLRSLEQRAREAEALAAAISAVAGSSSLDQALDTVARQAADLMGCPCSRLLLHDPASGLLLHHAGAGFRLELLRRVRVQPGVGWAGWAFTTGLKCTSTYPHQPGAPPRDPETDHLLALARLAPVQPEADQAVCIPLLLRDQPIGVLTVGGRRRPFGPPDMELLARLAEQASLAVEQARAREAEQVALLVEQVHRVVLEMDQVEDFDKVLPAVLHGLRTLGADPVACGVNIVDEAGGLLHIIQTLDIGGPMAVHCRNPLSLSANQQLLEYWRRGEVWERVPDAAFTEAVRESFGADYQPAVVIDVPFAEGTMAVGLRSASGLNAPWVQVLKALAPFISLGCRRASDLEVRRQAAAALRLDLALQRVRNEVLRLENEEGWLHLLHTIENELAGLISYRACGIQLVDHEAGTYHSGINNPVKTLDQVPASIRVAMEGGQPVYRRTRAELEAWGELEATPPDIHCVVDVPFAGGTIAINGATENAFSEEDIKVLSRFTQMLDEAHRRLLDLRRWAQSQERLRQAQRLESVGQLTAGIAHNFNNLLQANLTNIALAQLTAPPSLKTYLEGAYQAGERGADLVRQLMLFSRVESGQAALRPVDLKVLVEGTVSLCRKTIDRRIEIELALPGGLPLVQADPGQLEQVLLNLYLNARDALQGADRPTPWIRTTAGLVHRSEPGQTGDREYLCLTVSDNGVGMDEQTRERVFEPFFTTKEVGQGTGLGLATAFGILQQHQGWIECQSELGVGTTFSLYLPLAAAPAALPAAAEKTPLPVGGETLLIADDEDLVRRSTASIFTELGYQVLEAANGNQALELCRQHPRIDLILLDLSMPGLSGAEVLSQLRTDHPDIRVVVFTGYAPERGQLEGAIEVIAKPFSIPKLATAVRRALDGRRDTAPA
ncbi:MAG: GAF domain-containing protein [Candidatus Latescibacteria bacterium]|nr:GAF domain-containing protein [Candidatus Latescibacterota bacterium]